MFLVRNLFIISIVFILQGCASPKMAEELQQGKTSFAEGDFKQSFHELLPVAVRGNPQAQYAVGYMYYYGYGVPMDSDSGIFWMTKSADQGYQPAKDALKIIQGKNIDNVKAQRMHFKGESFSPTSVPPPQPKHEEEKLRVFPTSQKSPHAPRLKTAFNNTQFSKKDEVLQSLASSKLNSYPKTQHLAKANYTLQLFGSYELSDVKELQSKLASQKITRSWQTNREGKNWFVLTYGEFKTITAAKTALDTLPGPLRHMQPWVRPLDQLRVVG